MTTPANPDHSLLLQFIGSGGIGPWPMTSNPLATELRTTLLTADAATGTLRVAFEPDARYVQGNGAVQGGIVTAMLDFACAFVALMKLPPERVAVTVSQEVQFLRAARAGRLVAEARVRRLGATLAFTEATLAGSEGGEPCACASAVLAVVNTPAPR